MKVYSAGYWTLSDILVKVPEAQHILCSYIEVGRTDFEQGHRDKGLLDRTKFLDSGAFSALTLGRVIDINEYADYIKKNEKFLEVYANLDVIGNPEGTAKNQATLEGLGLKPLPTFHYGSDIKYLKALLKKYDYIALGGLVPLARRKKTLQQWLDYCWSEISKIKPLPKVHGFGLSSYWAWERYPFYSVDSTSWIQPGKFGEMTEFKNGQTVNKDKTQSNVMGYLLSQKGGYKQLMADQIREYLKMGAQVTKLWEHRGITWK